MHLCVHQQDLILQSTIMFIHTKGSELTMADIFQFLLSVEDFLHFSGSFRDCRGAEKDRLLDNAEQALRDIVYLEPLLLDGKSVVRTVVSCMREECEV